MLTNISVGWLGEETGLMICIFGCCCCWLQKSAMLNNQWARVRERATGRRRSRNEKKARCIMFWHRKLIAHHVVVTGARSPCVVAALCGSPPHRGKVWILWESDLFPRMFGCKVKGLCAVYYTTIPCCWLVAANSAFGARGERGVRAWGPGDVYAMEIYANGATNWELVWKRSEIICLTWQQRAAAG